MTSRQKDKTPVGNLLVPPPPLDIPSIHSLLPRKLRPPRRQLDRWLHSHCRSPFHFISASALHVPSPRPPPPPRPAVSRLVLPRPAPSQRAVHDEEAFDDDIRCHRQEKAAVQPSVVAERQRQETAAPRLALPPAPSGGTDSSAQRVGAPPEGSTSPGAYSCTEFLFFAATFCSSLIETTDRRPTAVYRPPDGNRMGPGCRSSRCGMGKGRGFAAKRGNRLSAQRVGAPHSPATSSPFSKGKRRSKGRQRPCRQRLHRR